MNLTIEDYETLGQINDFKEKKGGEFPEATILADMLVNLQVKLTQLESFTDEQKEQTAQVILSEIADTIPYLVNNLINTTELLKESVNYIDYFSEVVRPHSPELKHRLDQHGDLVYRYLVALKLAGVDERRLKKQVAQALYSKD